MKLFDATCTPAMEEAVLRVMRSGQIAGGPAVASFEARIEQLTGRSGWVTTSDMTSAISLALKLAEIGPGDEVATLAYSCMSSNAPIALAGATPVWVDMDPLTASMSVADLERAITPKTRAVLLYHVAGHPGPARDIAALCRSRDIVLIEDCNNAMGAQIDGRSVGTFGDYAVFSFYPNRQINSLEGAALVCPDDAKTEKARRFRRFGIDGSTFRTALGEINPHSDISDISGSATLSQVNAAAGLAHASNLGARLDVVAKNARRLHEGLTGLKGVQVVNSLDGAVAVHWAFLVLVEERDQTMGRLKAIGIPASQLHQRNDVYSGFRAHRRPLAGTDHFTEHVIGLPCGWWLDEGDTDVVIAAVKSATR